MDVSVKETFIRMKPICDAMMVSPTPEKVAAFVASISELENDHVHELQQYFLYPLITHIGATEIKDKFEQLKIIVDAMIVVLEKISVNSMEMCMKILTGLLPLIFDKTKPGMIAAAPEELKLSIMQCITVLMLKLNPAIRLTLLKNQVPLLAQIIYVSVHLAKLEKLRSLRLAGLNNVCVLTATHENFTDFSYQIKDSELEIVVVDMLASILPGVLAALQDVAMDADNPGHAVVVAALNAIHRVLCLTMHDKFLTKKSGITTQAFADLIAGKTIIIDKDVSNKGFKDIERRSPEWYAMAGEKLTLVVRSLAPLSVHQHVLVRQEFIILCARILMQCNESMQPSVPLVLDVLISLMDDAYPEVATYCSQVINTYFAQAPTERMIDTMDCLHANFLFLLTNMPRVLISIDAGRKLVALNLLHGYIKLLSDNGQPQRLSVALTSRGTLQALCDTLRHAASQNTHRMQFTTHVPTEFTAPAPHSSPWLEMRHLDSKDCVQRLQDVCHLLAESECAELLLDYLLDLFQQRECELAYILNCIGSGPKTPPALSKRILDTYLEEDLWYLPLELDNKEPPITKDETLDVKVYNPREWTKDSVPGLFEGATEIRYTGISYEQPRILHSSGGCSNLAQAQRNLVLCCLLTEGVGKIATAMKDQFQEYLPKTLCPILERVGSRYELLHLAGLKAMNAIALACGHSGVGELIAANGDYYLSQFTNKLKKVWNLQSALEILSVVMRYSDERVVLDHLFGLVDDVLVQSCDKYHYKDVFIFLQVFHTFITCIRKWFPVEEIKTVKTKDEETPDILADVVEFLTNKSDMEQLLINGALNDRGKSAQEMYTEDMNKKDEPGYGCESEYDDAGFVESPELPQHVSVTLSLLKRTVNFIKSQRREDSILALKVMKDGLPVLRDYENVLLPLVHVTWEPLAAQLRAEHPVMLAALDLVVTIAALTKDFIQDRAATCTFELIFDHLKMTLHESMLKEKGSAYRISHVYRLQEAMLRALPSLCVDLAVGNAVIYRTMLHALPYLSKNQPKTLQDLALNLFKHLKRLNYGGVWYFMRDFCDNDHVLPAPPEASKHIDLQNVTGTPFTCSNPTYARNVKLLFETRDGASK